MTTAQRRPGRWPYVLAAGVLVGGLAIGLTPVVKTIVDVCRLSSRMERLEAPGATTIHVKTPGRYVINYERRSVLGGKTYATGDTAPALHCTVTDTATDVAVPVKPASVKASYSLNSTYEGRALFEFEPARAGTYRVEARHPSPSSHPPVVLAVGPGVFDGSVGRFFFGLCVSPLICISCSVAAVAIFMTALTRRSRRSDPNIPVALPVPVARPADTEQP
ncbi:MAG: hypothetical protein ACOC95_06305 [Planctomycetota bacterium]